MLTRDPPAFRVRQTGMPRRPRVDGDAVLAASRSGLIRVRDLLALGVPSSTIAYRCRPSGGSWWHPLIGLVALARGTLTEYQRLVATLLYAGPDAVITGVAACRLYGMRRLPDVGDTVHVLVPHETRRRSQAFVLVERTTRMPTARERQEVPCAPVHRAVIDAARLLRRLDEVRAMLAEAVQQRLTTVIALRTEIEECSSRGAARVRSVIRELEAGVRSAAEAWCRELVARITGFPPVRWNVNVYLPDGTFVACADGFVEECALVIEVHSFEFHADPDAFDETMRRHAAMTAAGLVVVPVTPRQLRDRRAQVEMALRSALTQARARPCPAFVVAPSETAVDAA
jgi:hypothetical protein